MKFVAQWDNSDRSYVKYAYRMVSMFEKISLYYVHVQRFILKSGENGFMCINDFHAYNICPLINYYI
jgi:hypothetical protein